MRALCILALAGLLGGCEQKVEPERIRMFSNDTTGERQFVICLQDEPCKIVGQKEYDAIWDQVIGKVRI